MPKIPSPAHLNCFASRFGVILNFRVRGRAFVEEVVRGVCGSLSFDSKGGDRALGQVSNHGGGDCGGRSY